jgi:hypothetical protein
MVGTHKWMQGYNRVTENHRREESLPDGWDCEKHEQKTQENSWEKFDIPDKTFSYTLQLCHSLSLTDFFIISFLQCTKLLKIIFLGNLDIVGC